MSLSILTNSSATLASNNLESASARLQKSLNRLSSGSKIVSPSDDAGGLAVSTKMSAAIKRQAATSSNISNSISYLQTQDGALQKAGAILERIGELKMLASDVTKNTTDVANYDTEFTQLRAQLSALGDEKFNGISLFSASTLSVSTTSETGGASVDIGGVNLLAGSSVLFSDDFAGSSLSSSWGVISGSPVVSGGMVALAAGDYIEEVNSTTGPLQLRFEMQMGTTASDNMQFGTGVAAIQIEGTELSGSGWHEVAVDILADGTVSSMTIDGNPYSFIDLVQASQETPVRAGLFGGSGASSGVNIRNYSLVDTSTSDGNVNTVASASGLSDITVDDIKSATEDIATYRAQNGAQQSRLQFAQEQLTVNQSNLEAANSRITDVDVAEESTQLARFNILQQAGASMLTQANQSQQIALRLLG